MQVIIVKAAMERVAQLRAEADSIEEAIKKSAGNTVGSAAMEIASGLTQVAKKLGRAASSKGMKKKPRNLSPEARKRIADAQTKRWAAARAKKAKVA